jgi:ketosteroid isomerase-like protein
MGDIAHARMHSPHFTSNLFPLQNSFLKFFYLRVRNAFAHVKQRFSNAQFAMLCPSTPSSSPPMIAVRSNVQIPSSLKHSRLWTLGRRQPLLTMPNQSTSGDIHAAVMAAHQAWMASFRQGDAAGVAALYAEAGQLLPAYSTAISGRAAIQAFWQGCIDMGICAMSCTPLEVDCLAETVNEVGEYRFLVCHNRVLDVGKYVVIWKLQRGQWKVQRHIWTSNRPAAQ